MLASHLTIALLLALSTLLWAQASPNMAPGYQQTYDRLLQQIDRSPSSTTTAIPASPKILTWTQWPLPPATLLCA